MQINNINTYSYQPNFQSSRQHVLDKAGRVINCHYTNMNRKDVCWEKFVKLLDMRYRNQQPVKINIFGCSDASEVYTLKLYLIKYLGKNADKFQLFASDISPEIIAKANKGEIKLHDEDLKFLDSVDGRKYFERDYSAPIETLRGIDFYKYNVHQDLRENITFSVKDIRDESKWHDFRDEVCIFRCGWTFMDLDSQNSVVNNFSKHSNPLSLFMIGQSDLFKSNVCEFFQKNGFKGIKTDVYMAAETDYPSMSIGMPKEKSTYPEFILFEKIA